jgi:hypothetical protein
MGFTRFFQNWRQREVVTVLGLGFLMLILWRIPLFGLLFYPFQLFNTFVHELSHGLAAIVTGGGFNRFVVRPDLSGTAWSVGGIQWIIVSAGYIGSAIFGGILTILAAWGTPARSVLFWLGVALGLLCLLFVRNLFGIVSGFGLAAGLMLAGRRLGPLWADGLLLLLAVQAMLNSLDSMFDLIGFSLALGSPRTDAQIMQGATGIPAIFWALLWTAISVVILVGSLRLAYYRVPEPVARQRAGG